jgi:DNA-directed RNA polymerase specialized sigma24 family protein
MDAARQWDEMIDFDTILKQLGEADAGMVRMKYKSNITNVAIAKELKMSEAGVRKRMAKAHENIKEIIMKMIDNYEQ